MTSIWNFLTAPPPVNDNAGKGKEYLHILTKNMNDICDELYDTEYPLEVYLKDGSFGGCFHSIEELQRYVCKLSDEVRGCKSYEKVSS